MMIIQQRNILAAIVITLEINKIFLKLVTLPLFLRGASTYDFKGKNCLAFVQSGISMSMAYSMPALAVPMRQDAFY